jgi:hypothetical protein
LGEILFGNATMASVYPAGDTPHSATQSGHRLQWQASDQAQQGRQEPFNDSGKHGVLGRLPWRGGSFQGLAHGLEPVSTIVFVDWTGGRFIGVLHAFGGEFPQEGDRKSVV